MASKHRDIGLKFRYRSTPNTRRVTKNVGFGGGGGGTIYIDVHQKPLGYKVLGMVQSGVYVNQGLG